ncbi:transposase [Pontibacterium granulatum]|uniref:REP-associated tyrosine transposase n=1 Tax=Pontibacterium granulatum TaxID=2036029 RepID=UPI00249B2A86|nr:transposase [Pontibacterium granulatum]MDI3323291.1 transposase [Pontibacterium granulatum]
MGRSRYKFYQPDQPHFMTLTVLHWIPVFTRPETVNILLESLEYLSKQRLRIYAFVVLENHLHLIAQSSQLDRDIARFKSYSARRIIDYLQARNVKTILEQLACYKKAHKQDREIQLWQEGVHPELIQEQEMMRHKIEYIHQNPVKRGYVDEAAHWRYSSARNYDGKKGLLEVCRDW